jgi:hypothetical protein
LPWNTPFPCLEPRFLCEFAIAGACWSVLVLVGYLLFIVPYCFLLSKSAAAKPVFAKINCFGLESYKFRDSSSFYCFWAYGAIWWTIT